MKQIKAITFIEQKKEYLFPNDEYDSRYIEELLMAAPDGSELLLDSIPFRDPSTVKLISIFVGSIGIDRFYLGDIGKGVLKYFSLGGLGVWWIKDIISAKDRCRAYNCKKLIEALDNPEVIAKMQDMDNKISRTVDMGKKIAPIAKDVAKDVKKMQDSFYVN